MQYLALIVVACLFAGCARDVVMLNPRTGETVTCTDGLRGLTPWSQKEACVGGYIAQGWRRADGY